MILVAAPAGAAPPNEVALARHFAELGLIPAYATPEMALVSRQLDGRRRAQVRAQVAARAALDQGQEVVAGALPCPPDGRPKRH